MSDAANVKACESPMTALEPAMRVSPADERPLARALDTLIDLYQERDRLRTELDHARGQRDDWRERAVAAEAEVGDLRAKAAATQESEKAAKESDLSRLLRETARCVTTRNEMAPEHAFGERPVYPEKTWNAVLERARHFFENFPGGPPGEVKFLGITEPGTGCQQYGACLFTIFTESSPDDLEKLFSKVADAILRAQAVVEGPLRVRGYPLPDSSCVQSARLEWEGIPIRLLCGYRPDLGGYMITADFVCEGLPDGFFDFWPERVS